MLQLTALLALLLSLLSGGAATPTCTTESWEDRSAVATCVSAGHHCTAWVDAETQKIAAVQCK